MMFKPSSAAIAPYLEPPDVHDVNRERAPGTGIALLFAAILTLAHGLNIYFFFIADNAPYVGLLFHMALVVLTGVIARTAIVAGNDSRFLMVLLITSAGMSIFGAAGTFLAVVLYKFYIRRALPFAVWFSTMFPRHRNTVPEQTYEDIVIGRDESAKQYSVMPFLEVMELGSEVQKREALSKMTMLFHPAFAPAFKRALVDESNMIRVQAATAITRIENQFVERLIRLTDLYLKNPEDPNLVLALAQHYDAYAFTGILDAERERTNRQAALQHYLEYLRLRPNDEAASIEVGRLYLRSDQAEKAADWLTDCVRRNMRKNELLIWYAEALFQTQRYAELRAIAAQFPGLADRLNDHSRLLESMQLWAGKTPPGNLTEPLGLPGGAA